MEKSHSIDKSTHSTHGMRSKKKNNEFEKFRERKRKKNAREKKNKCRKINFHLCTGKISSIWYQRSQAYGCYVCNEKKNVTIIK